jgi:hypothetical protein
VTLSASWLKNRPRSASLEKIAAGPLARLVTWHSAFLTPRTRGAEAKCGDGSCLVGRMGKSSFAKPPSRQAAGEKELVLVVRQSVDRARNIPSLIKSSIREPSTLRKRFPGARAKMLVDAVGCFDHAPRDFVLCHVRSSLRSTFAASRLCGFAWREKAGKRGKGNGDRSIC